MSSINLFNNDSLNVTIKTITDNNNVLWFRAKDIALFLGYKNTIDAIKRHVDDKYKTQLCDIEYGSTSVFHACCANSKITIYIKEFGLYQLIFASKKSKLSNLLNGLLKM